MSQQKALAKFCPRVSRRNSRGSSSSFAALPVSLRSATHNLGVDKDYAAFAVPLAEVAT